MFLFLFVIINFSFNHPKNDYFLVTSNSTSNQTSPTILFQSGFEGIHLSLPIDGYQYLTGTDSASGFDWPISILGSNFSGIHVVK